MLRKLLKYEFSAIAKELAPIYLLIIVVTLITNVLFTTGFDTATGLSFIVLGALSIAAVVLTLVMVCQRFSKNLLKDEGYLMFTLPVSATELLWSKLIASTLWILIGAAVGIVCGVITVLVSGAVQLSEINDTLSFIAKFVTVGDTIVFGEMLIWGILCILLFLLTVYLSLSATQLPIFSGRETLRKITPVITFIIAYSAHNGILTALSNLLHISTDITTLNTVTFLPMLGFELIFVAVFFFLVNFILNKHLNLE